MTTPRLIFALLAAAALLPAVSLRADEPDPRQSLTALNQINTESRELYRLAMRSLVRVNITHSPAAVLDPALKTEFDDWQKNPTLPANGNRGGRGGQGGPGGANRGPREQRDQRDSKSDPRPEGPPSGSPGGPPFAMRGGLTGQVRAFLEYKAEKSPDPKEAARLRGLALRVELNRNGIQGELSAVLLDDRGHALLPTGLLREAHAANNTLKVDLPDGTQTRARYLGSNLFGGYTLIELEKTSGLTPASWSRNLLLPGDWLMSIAAAQGATSFVVAPRLPSAPPEAPIPDHFVVAADDRSGAFLFDTRGKLAAFLAPALWGGWGGPGGGMGAGRQALTAKRMQREIDFILATGKDIEPRPIGISYKPLDPDSDRGRALSAILGTRRAVIVDKVEPDSLAAKAGIHEHDILTSIDDRPLTELPHVLVDIATRHDPVPVGLIRADSDSEALVNLPIGKD